MQVQAAAKLNLMLDAVGTLPDGYHSLYLYDVDGRLVKRLTPVDADVAYAGMSPDGKYVYYTSAEVSPVENHLFRVEVKSGKTLRLTPDEGWHTVALNDACTYFTDNFSSLNVPRVLDVRTAAGKQARRERAKRQSSEACGHGSLSPVFRRRRSGRRSHTIWKVPAACGRPVPRGRPKGRGWIPRVRRRSRRARTSRRSRRG